MEGTFSHPMQTPNGPIAPTGKKFRLLMSTVAHWKNGVMNEEYPVSGYPAKLTCFSATVEANSVDSLAPLRTGGPDDPALCIPALWSGPAKNQGIQRFISQNRRLAVCPDLDYIQICTERIMSPPRRMTSAAEAKSQWLDKTRFAPANRRRLSPAALRTFLAIADLWGLTEEQRLLVLGYPSRSTYHNWAKQAREHGSFTLDVDILTRISAMLGIHQALGILFPTERLGVEWLRTPHDAIVFGGQPPLALVTSGSQDGLLAVRRFLDGARGGTYMQPNEVDRAFVPYGDSELVFR